MAHVPLQLFHILIVFPVLFYIALFRGLVPPWVYTMILLLGVLILIYHAFRLIVKWNSGGAIWINLIHILFVGPLLIYIGKNEYDTPRWAYEVLAMGAFATLGYNLYSIVVTVTNLPTA